MFVLVISPYFRQASPIRNYSVLGGVECGVDAPQRISLSDLDLLGFETIFTGTPIPVPHGSRL
jgi:hypothetical protein